METFRTFATEQQARDYRYAHGTGGWIFVPVDCNGSMSRPVLFPPHMPPKEIMHHPFTKGRNGRLIGSQ